jgi:hypothetical protein
MTPPRAPEPSWEDATFAGASALRDRQARLLSLAERYRWLDEMYTLCHFRALQRGELPPSLRFDRYLPAPPLPGHPRPDQTARSQDTKE